MEIDSQEERQAAAAVFGWMALFGGLNPPQIAAIAASVDLVYLEAGEVLFTQGAQGDSFYIIISGKLRVTRGQGKNVTELATLVPGDYLGEESLLYGVPRTATITAAEPSKLARFPKASFNRLIKNYPEIKDFLAATINSRRLARKQNVSWLDTEETIYLMARKHQAYLLVSLITPVIIGLISVPLFYFSMIQEEANTLTTILNWAGFIFLMAGIAYGIWRAVDWGNDFYIVTNQRVIWLEKVVGLYDSRQEAPLSTVLAVGTTSDLLGRFLGYGNVVVRTFTGQIVMLHVGFPEQLARIVDEQRDRAKTAKKVEETQALEAAIRKRLGMDKQQPEPQPNPDGAPRIVTRPVRAKKQNALQVWLRDFFKVRYDLNGVVTFRKHWILLLQKIWLPTLLGLGLFLLLVGRLANWYEIIPVQWAVVVIFTFMMVVALWWLYNYLDWSNDIYQVTDEQIIDVYKKPLGKEDKKTAQLENILEIEQQRRGIIGILLNFGDVVAMVGSTKFTFEGVYNPAIVAQEIFQHINARKRRIRDAEETAQRERIADWLAAYHRQTHPEE